MNANHRFFVHYLLSLAGLRVHKHCNYRNLWDLENYPHLKGVENPVIFDVGANVGQTSNSFRRIFPDASICAFEPFASCFTALQKHTKGNNINCFKIGLSDRVESRTVEMQSNNPNFTMNSVRDIASGKTPAHLKETIMLTTADEFCREQNISFIHVLKSDTEGHELEVLDGAKSLLSKKQISYLAIEAGISREDKGLTHLDDLRGFLGNYGYHMRSILDVAHGADGRTLYLNVIFSHE